MQSFIDRLVAEHTELTERIQKLEVFLASDKVNTIDPDQAMLLAIQLPIMKAYQHVLGQRIELTN